MNHFAPIKSAKRLSGAQKSAILFLCLGEDRGGALMQQLDVAEIRKITGAISTMGEVQADVVEEIMEEFGERIGEYGSVRGSVEAARSLLAGFLPAERVAQIFQEIDGATTGNVWEDLSQLDSAPLADFLRKEHNQTIAVILSNLTPEATARLLPIFGMERSADLIERMMDIENLPSDALKNIEDGLRREILASAGNDVSAKSEKQLVSVFNKLDESVFEELARKLEATVPDQFRVLKQKMFVFDDLGKLKQMMLAKVMREVSGKILPLALRGAKKEVREHFLSCLPARSRDMLQEEMKSMGAIRSKDVKVAQSQIVEITLQLLAQGEIELPSDDKEEMIE